MGVDAGVVGRTDFGIGDAAVGRIIVVSATLIHDRMDAFGSLIVNGCNPNDFTSVIHMGHIKNRLHARDPSNHLRMFW